MVVPGVSPGGTPVPSRSPGMEGGGFLRMTANCARRITVRRTRHYLGYGREPYMGNYPMRVTVPSFVGRITRNGFTNTCSMVSRSDSLPTIYNHIYPRRSRYRSGYMENVGARPIKVNELREFITS